MNTEPKYIDANKIDWHYIPLAAMPDLYTTKTEVDALPAEDVEIVRHGEWIPIQQTYHWGDTGVVDDIIIGYRCSVCSAIEKFKYKYCHCGAKMDKEKEE